MARDTSEDRALVVALDEGTGMFDEFAVLDGGGAGGFAGAAGEGPVGGLGQGLGGGGGGRMFPFRSLERGQTVKKNSPQRAQRSQRRTGVGADGRSRCWRGRSGRRGSSGGFGREGSQPPDSKVD